MIENSLLDFVTEPVTDTRASPAERFEVWAEANANVLALFEQFATEARAAGQAKLGAKAIIERIRWHCTVETKPLPGDVFKINNDYAPYLARWLIAKDPTFDGFFELREIHG